MPYRRKGRIIETKSSGTWKKKQTCKSVANAKKAMLLLRGLEHGSIKSKDVGKPKRKRKKK